MTWAPQQGELINERFLLEDLLARGGMGSVWIAHHVTLDCPCAVKFIDEGYARVPELRKRFEVEARTAARLRSRHIVQILDYGVWKGVPYIAMELLEGESLADRLEREGRLSPEATLAVLQGVVRALSKARVLEIVHRDLKPENIFLVSEGEQEYAKVLDFGIAKLRDPDRYDLEDTDPGKPLGTPFYMSPEQAHGTVELDYRSDLWSLGVIAFECLTGEAPFQGESFGDLAAQIASGPIPLPSDVHDELPESVDEWWLRAAERDRDKRYQTAGELYEALEAAFFPDGDRIPPDRPSRVSWTTPGRGARDWTATSRPPLSSKSLPPPPSEPPVSHDPPPRAPDRPGSLYAAGALALGVVVVVAWLALGGDEAVPATPPLAASAPLPASAPPSPPVAERPAPAEPTPPPSASTVPPPPPKLLPPPPLPTPPASATASAPKKWETGY